MVQNPPPGFPRVTPYLLYEDANAALDWLARAFGFRVRERIADAGGKVTHAEIELDGGVVMLGCPGPDYRGPKRHGHVHAYVYAYVDDVNAHFERAKAADAKILTVPEDQYYGDRRYSAEDPEGHQWFFAQHVRDVSPEEMKPPA